MRRILIVLFSTLIISSCGGGEDVASGSGSGLDGSGFGGTGISLVKGNIASVDGQAVSQGLLQNKLETEILLADFFLVVSHAQSFNPASITVRGGGVSSQVNQSGEFLLLNVTPADNFVLTFDIEGAGSVSLSIGRVTTASATNVENVRINTSSGSADSDNVSSESTKTGSNSETSEDDNSEDDISEDNSDDADEDDDKSEDEEESADDDSEDDDSEDDVSEDDPGN